MAAVAVVSCELSQLTTNALAPASAASPPSAQPVPKMTLTASLPSIAAATSLNTSSSISGAGAFPAFLRAYTAAAAPEFQDQLMSSLRLTIFAACRKYGASEEAAAAFFKGLQAEAFKHKEELLENIAESAALIWTSAVKLRLAPGHTIEFCSLLNRILRDGDPDLLQPSCCVVRGINLLCVTRSEPSKMRYPPGGMSHRGGGMPLTHLPFFTEGKKFRVPMYLATSFDEDVAYRLVALLMTACHDCSLTCCRFWYMAFDRGEPPVHWIIRVDPRGETSFR